MDAYAGYLLYEKCFKLTYLSKILLRTQSRNNTLSLLCRGCLEGCNFLFHIDWEGS